MANNEPVRLDGWTAGRPVKLADQENEKAYASRQERTKVTLRLPTQVADQLRVWCATTKQTAQDLVTQLLVSHFRMDGQTATDLIKIDDLDDEVKRSSETSSSRSSTGRPDGQPRPTEPLTDSQIAALPDLEREALKFYSTWTGNQVKHRDRAAFADVAALPRHAILAGIGVSRLRARQPIRSLKYCLGAIAETAEAGVGPDYLQNVMRYLRQLAAQPNLPSIGGDVVNAEFGGEPEP